MNQAKKPIQKHRLAIFLIFLATAIVSYFYGTWFNYPQGYDALFHILKSELIIKNWPAYQWWAIWAGGMPLFLYYPPFPHYLIVILKLISGLSFELILTSLSVLAIGFSALGIYLLAYKLTKNRLFSFLGSLVYLACPGSWGMALEAGVYLRSLAMPFLVFALYWASLFCQKFQSGEFDRKSAAFTSLFLGLGLLTHQHTALVALASVTFLIFFITRSQFSLKLAAFVRISLFAFLISAVFFLPFLVFLPHNPTFAWVSPYAQTKVPLKDLFFFSQGQPTTTISYNYSRLIPFLIPLEIFLFLLVLLFRFPKLTKAGFTSQMLEFSGWMTVFWFTYSYGSLVRLVKILPMINNLYASLATNGATYFMPIYLSLAISLLLSLLISDRKRLSWLITIFCLIALSWFLNQEQLAIKSTLIKKNLPTHITSQKFILPVDLEEKINQQQVANFRFGLDPSTKLNLIFNHCFPNYSQVGHYFSQGIINFDDYYYLEETLWRRPKKSNAIPFLLDWWAIKPIVTLNRNQFFDQFPGYQETNTKEGLNFYQYQDVSPILAPSQAPLVLVIGRHESYNAFLISLAAGNINSQKLIPVPAQKPIENYQIQELAKFDLVFLYDYQSNYFQQAAQILTQYVKQGGRLIIESQRDFETNQNLPDPFPIKTVKPITKENWQFQIQKTTNYLNQESLGQFSPANYDHNSWVISAGQEIKPWAQVILNSSKDSVLIEGKIGQGRVLWSGLNLPFHISYYQNPQEAQLLGQMIADLSLTTPEKVPGFELILNQPQKKQLKLDQTSHGILFKETYFSNWHAYAKLGKRNLKLKIYPAGPGFMTVKLPPQTQEVTFVYCSSWIEKISLLISLFSLFWLLNDLRKPNFSIKPKVFVGEKRLIDLEKKI